MGNCLCEIDADCNDGNACTVDTCNQVNGVCEHTPVADGTSCGGAAVCVAASCRDLECETDLDCNDFKDCTTDSCVSFGFCETPPVEDGTPCAGGECEAGECSLASSVVPCTEQAIRNAIAAGGGPYTFDCDGPTTVVTEAEIVINNNVILDGEGKLTVDGNGAHRVFTVLEAYPELRGMSITGGLGTDGTGGIFIAWGLTLKDCTVSDNGGYGIGSQGGLTLVNSIVSGNAEGGIRSDHMTLVNSIVSGNGGPGIESAGPNPVSLTNITVSGNTAGGIVCRCDGGQATLTGSRVTGNTGGSGVTLQGGEMIIVDSTISGNVNDSTAGGPFEQVGGGIRNHVGTMTLINSTVSGNTALLEGDGISSAAGLVNGEMDGVLKIIASTVSDEVHAYGAAAIFPSIEFTSTVMEGSCVETGNPATWVSNGHNIESPGNTCGFDQPTDQVNVSAEQLKLGPLQDNGGPTMTHALLPGSVAIDQIPEAECVDADGESLTTDQRGEPRPETGGTMCDVGAFEVQP
jgi:hypothetical protein